MKIFLFSPAPLRAALRPALTVILLGAALAAHAPRALAQTGEAADPYSALLRATHHAEIVRGTVLAMCRMEAREDAKSRAECENARQRPDEVIDQAALPFLRRHVSEQQARDALAYYNSPEGRTIARRTLAMLKGEPQEAAGERDLAALQAFNASPAGLAMRAFSGDKAAGVAISGALTAPAQNPDGSAVEKAVERDNQRLAPPRQEEYAEQMQLLRLFRWAEIARNRIMEQCRPAALAKAGDAQRAACRRAALVSDNRLLIVSAPFLYEYVKPAEALEALDFWRSEQGRKMAEKFVTQAADATTKVEMTDEERALLGEYFKTPGGRGLLGGFARDQRALDAVTRELGRGP